MAAQNPTPQAKTETQAPAPQAAAAKTEPVAAPAPAPTPAKAGKTILVVEDDPILSRMYSEKLSFEGFNVLNAYNGEDAVTITDEKAIDAILLDIMLPRLSGTDFLEQLRQKPKGKNTIVIVLTNLDQADEKKKAMDLGVKEYLVKANQTPETVVQNIRKYL